MANEQKIDEIIDPSALKQIDELITKLTAARKEFVGFAEAISKANKAIVSGQSIKDLETNAARAQALADKARKSAADAATAEEKLNQVKARGIADFEAKVQKEIALEAKRQQSSKKRTDLELVNEIKIRDARRKAFDRYEAQLRKQDELEAKRAKQIEANIKPYTVLSNTLETLRKNAQNLAVIFGEESEQFKKAAKEVIELDTRLKGIDAALGKFQRSVGNYASGFSQFGNAVNQLTRELPALAVNAQTFFLAISNNLPALFDAFEQAGKARKEAAAAAVAEAEAAGISATANEIAAGATQEAADAAGELAKEQALAGAEALKTPGAFKQFLGALFSLQSLLSVGVTLLTLYGAQVFEYIGALIKGKDALSEFNRMQEIVDEARSKGRQDSAQEITQLKVLYGVTQDTTISLKQRKEAVDEIQKQWPKQFKNLSDENILAGKAKDAYDLLTKSIIATATARAFQDVIAENAKRRFLNEEALAKREVEYNEAKNKQKLANDKAYLAATTRASDESSLQNSTQITAADNERAAAAKLIRDIKKDTQILDERDLKLQEQISAQVKLGADLTSGPEDANTKVDTSSFDAEKARVERSKNAAKEIVDNEKNSLDIRLEALRVYTQKSTELTDINFNREVARAKGNKDEVIFLTEQLETDKQKVLIEGREIEGKINDDAQKKLKSLLKEGTEEYIKAENKKVDAMVLSDKIKLEELSSYQDDALRGAAEQLSKGIINEKQYNKIILDIQRQYVLDSINEEIRGLERIIAVRKAAKIDTTEDEKALAEVRKKLSKETADQEIKDFKDVAKEQKKLNEAKKELSEEVAEFGISLVNASFENQKNKIQAEIDQVDVRSQKEIEAVNQSVASEQEKADKIAVIEARANAAKSILEQQQRQIQQRQARFDKAVTIAKVIADTASAIVEALPNIPLSVVVGAIGAAQIATVLATPIPQYKDGTLSSAEGYALTDEVGPELYIPKSGKPYIGSSKGANVKWLEKGTQVVPHDDLIRMTTLMHLPDQMEGKSWDLLPLINAQKKSGERIENAIKGSSRTVITPSAWFGSQQNMGSIEAYIQRNFRK